MLNTEVTRTLKAEDVTSHRAWIRAAITRECPRTIQPNPGVADYMSAKDAEFKIRNSYYGLLPFFPNQLLLSNPLKLLPPNGNNFPWDTVNRANCRLQNLSGGMWVFSSIILSTFPCLTFFILRSWRKQSHLEICATCPGSRIPGKTPPL